jgi:riboflavin biosynthesis pyrimidine reductase
MEPIVTLYERTSASPATLPPTLATLYGGGLALPQGKAGRSYVIANFVETLDGVVSYNTPDQAGGGAISGDNAQDKMVMGLLRASADAVIFGSNSLRIDADHLHIPSFIFPALANDYDALRSQSGRQGGVPLSVIMTASGRINLDDRTFHTPGLKAVIATTPRGAAQLWQKSLPEGTDVRVVEMGDAANQATVSPRATLALLAREYDVRVALYEGGPTLLASFLLEQQLDELFVTLAPQVVGRTNDLQRLSLMQGHAFTPTGAPQGTLQSVKLAGSYLLLRYSISS